MEVWKTIPFENRYAVSNTGKVKNRRTEWVKSLRKDRYGYERVTLYPSGKTHTVHRLVMLTFSPEGEKEGLQVNHIDGDKTNNHIGNLEWVTARENSRHRDKYLNPEKLSGEKNPMAKLTEAEAIQIKYGKFSGLNNREIGDEFGVSSEVVRRIRSGERWTHI